MEEDLNSALFKKYFILNLLVLFNSIHTLTYQKTFQINKVKKSNSLEFTKLIFIFI